MAERSWRYDEPTARQVRLGRLLEQQRKAAGKSQREVAEALGWKGGASKTSRVESGRVGVSDADLERMLALYGVTDRGLKAYIKDLKSRGTERGWETEVRDVASSAYADLIGHEEDAQDAYATNLTLVSGLLQTARYRAAVIDEHMPDIAPEEREQRLVVHGKRQEVFKRPNPLVFWGVISESAFRHVIGSPEIMAEQLDHILGLREAYPHVINIQVLPEAAACHAALFGPSVILSFPERYSPDIVYLEGFTTNRFLEEPGEVQAYTRLYNRLMTESLPGAKSIELIKKYRDTYSKG
ncbi:helix-turn-helix domain-containing protein [Streptomyces sp. KR55]|uniref:helix-turn-helix domain-containing protein n=1 Tax=Streptomyces sp. KR55 TaxID=3457425 RepID=UPI003FCF4610